MNFILSILIDFSLSGRSNILKKCKALSKQHDLESKSNLKYILSPSKVRRLGFFVASTTLKQLANQSRPEIQSGKMADIPTNAPDREYIFQF